MFDIVDFTHVRPSDLRDRCCLVVGTIQTLRVKSTEGRKVYAHHEEMEPHFAMVPATAPGLERTPSGTLKFSFANLLYLHQPLMIVDEAHNAVTGLTRDMQKRVNPCAIIEFTATPRGKSNILHSVNAHELKREDMIKLPIILAEHDSWQNAVNGAIAARAALAQTTQDDPDYIRPLVLFQAQPKDQEVTVEVLKQHLMDVERIPADRIAVATGDQRQLDGVDLFDRACPIEFVITVEALKEGWDCSFAYVFCSVSRIHSATDVEQLLGRVLRMPYAKRRCNAELNKAYSYLSEPSFAEAARVLVDKLVAMGFEEDEARDSIEPMQEAFEMDEDLFGPRDQPPPVFAHTFAAGPDDLGALQAVTREGFTVREGHGGQVDIEITGPIDGSLRQDIYEALPPRQRTQFADDFAAYQARLTPAEQGQPFVVPRLMTEIQGELVFADTSLLMEHHDWSLLDHSPKMGSAEFDIHETARSFEIDLDGRRVAWRFSAETEQLALDAQVDGWTPETLVLWLDRQVRQPDISQGDLLRWLSDLVGHLVQIRGMAVASLMRCKYLLAGRIERRIKAIRQQERNGVYQRRLFDPDARVEVSFSEAFSFADGMYRDQRRYRGRWIPNKHFLGPNNVPAFDGADDGEEVQCAQVLDKLPGVAYWIRNVARHPASFWLPTATDRFYPDFIARLKDGRLLVLEYKGEHIADGSDTREKRVIGELWQRSSDGQCLFTVVEKVVNGRDARQQLEELLMLRGLGVVPTQERR